MEQSPWDPRRFGLGYWFSEPAEPPSHPIYLVLTVLLVLALAAAIYVHLAAPTWSGASHPKVRLIGRFASLFMGLCIAGLAAIMFQLLQVPFLGKRIWLLLTGMGIATAAAYAYYFYRVRWPVLAESYATIERRRRLVPRAGSGRRRRRRH